jgi:hypothetical protein
MSRGSESWALLQIPAALARQTALSQPAQEASAIFRRKANYEELHLEKKRGGDRNSDQVAESAT